MLLLVVFIVFDWFLGFGCIEDVEIYGRLDRHCSCLFRVHAFIDPAVGCVCQGHQLNCYIPTHTLCYQTYMRPPQ